MLDWFRKSKGEEKGGTPGKGAAQPDATASVTVPGAPGAPVGGNLPPPREPEAAKPPVGGAAATPAVVDKSPAPSTPNGGGTGETGQPGKAEAPLPAKTGDGAGKAAEADKKPPEAPAKPGDPASQAPDRPAKLPPSFADSASTVLITREDVKLQAPTIAVTVPASAVVSLPSGKTEPLSAPAVATGTKDVPRGEGPPAASGSGKIEPPLPSPLPHPMAEREKSAAVPGANVSGTAVSAPTAAKSAPAPAPTAPKPATWKNLPAKEPWCPAVIAAQAPELRKVAAADAVAFERVLPGWRAAGASRRGRMHANGGTHREDSLAFDAHDRATVLCVSDGAGSCQHSRIGSHVAAHRVVELLLAATEKVDPVIAADATKLKEHLSAKVTEAAVAATEALLELAKKSGCAPKDFRCTLLTALHYRGESHELLLTNQIGDGAICLLKKDKSTVRLGSSDSGTHSGEVSCFVPDDCAWVKAKAVDCVTPVEPIECVLLCSDGIEDPFYPLEKQAADIFRQYYTGVDQPLKDFKAQPTQPAPLLQESAAWGLAQWLEFEKRGENDDRTVAVLHRLPVGI